MNYPYSMVIQWSDEDSSYLVHLPEFPWQQYHTHGETYEEAARHGQEVIESLIEWYQEQGKPLPEPSTFGRNISTWRQNPYHTLSLKKSICQNWMLPALPEPIALSKKPLEVV